MFRSFAGLQILDLQQNKIKPHIVMLTGLGILQTLYVDKFTICCVRPTSVSGDNCVAPLDVFSSCANMIEIGALHVCVWFTVVLSISGNAIALIFKIHHRKLILKSRDVLMTNLCLSDMIIGVYLLIVGLQGRPNKRCIWQVPRWNDGWLRSTLCEVAGCLSTFSCEVSTFTIFAITVDRYYVFKHPFGRNEQRQRRISLVFVIVSWICSFDLAVLPTITTNIFGEEFYGHCCVCISLPLTRQSLVVRRMAVFCRNFHYL